MKSTLFFVLPFVFLVSFVSQAQSAEKKQDSHHWAENICEEAYKNIFPQYVDAIAHFFRNTANACEYAKSIEIEGILAFQYISYDAIYLSPYLKRYWNRFQELGFDRNVSVQVTSSFYPLFPASGFPLEKLSKQEIQDRVRLLAAHPEMAMLSIWGVPTCVPENLNWGSNEHLFYTHLSLTNRQLATTFCSLPKTARQIIGMFSFNYDDLPSFKKELEEAIWIGRFSGYLETLHGKDIQKHAELFENSLWLLKKYANQVDAGFFARLGAYEFDLLSSFPESFEMYFLDRDLYEYLKEYAKKRYPDPIIFKELIRPYIDEVILHRDELFIYLLSQILPLRKDIEQWRTIESCVRNYPEQAGLVFWLGLKPIQEIQEKEEWIPGQSVNELIWEAFEKHGCHSVPYMAMHIEDAINNENIDIDTFKDEIKNIDGDFSRYTVNEFGDLNPRKPTTLERILSSFKDCSLELLELAVVVLINRLPVLGKLLSFLGHSFAKFVAPRISKIIQGFFTISRVARATVGVQKILKGLKAFASLRSVRIGACLSSASFSSVFYDSTQAKLITGGINFFTCMRNFQNMNKSLANGLKNMKNVVKFSKIILKVENVLQRMEKFRKSKIFAVVINFAPPKYSRIISASLFVANVFNKVVLNSPMTVSLLYRLPKVRNYTEKLMADFIEAGLVKISRFIGERVLVYRIGKSIDDFYVQPLPEKN